MTTQDASKAQIFLARLVLALLLGFGALGLIWYAREPGVGGRIWENLRDRPGGPMTFRFVLQPLMAAIIAWLDGVNDAKLGRSPYLWAILTNRGESVRRLYEGLIATARVILLGLCMDVIYQFIVLKTLYPGEAVIVAIVLGFIPYLLLRGPFARIARWRRGATPAHET